MKKTNNNRQIYDEHWGEWTEMKKLGPASRWLRVLIKNALKDLKKNEIKTVLDVGCGEGSNTYFLASVLGGANVVGIDFSKSGIKLAQNNYKKNNLRFEYDLKSKQLNKKYDLVTAFEVLEHVHNWRKLLGRMTDSANYLLLSFPTGRMRDFEKNVGHVRNFKKGEVETFLYKKGFEGVSIYYAGFPFYSPIYRELCNLTDSANNSFTKSYKYSAGQKIVSDIFFYFFKHFSTKRKYGDQFCGLFKRVSE